jgi:hypothetical protein
MKKSWELSRRTFLRGAGTLMALPVLEAMAPSLAQAQTSGAPPPRRLMAFFVPNGMYPAEWYPATSGEGYTLSPLLAPLAAHKSDFLVLSGLGNKPSHFSTVDVGHVASTSTFLTASSVGERQDLCPAGLSSAQSAQRAGRRVPRKDLSFTRLRVSRVKLGGA